VRVLIVPSAVSEAGRLRFDQLVPNPDTLQKITDRLEESRVIGTRAIVEPPVYRGITVVARLRARSRINPTRLQEEALLALYEYFHPISGGPDGSGWPFGRPINVGEVYSVLQGMRGTELVEDARLFGADPVTGQRGQQTQRLELEPHALVFSYEHQVLVDGACCAASCPGSARPTRWGRRCRRSTRTTTSRSGCCRAWIRCWRPS
jgi:hypothetical protein